MTPVLPAPALTAISADLRTSHELMKLVGQIEECQRLLFTSKDAHTKVLEGLPHPVVERIPDEITTNQKLLDEWLHQLIKELRKLPVATVTIAYLPTMQQAYELVKMIRSGFGRNVIIDLNTEPELLAGVRIEFGNKQIQYSLRADMEEVLKEVNA